MQELNTGAAGLNRWLLARVRRKRGPTSQAALGDSPAPTQRMLAVSRLIVAFAILAVATTLLGTGFGYRLARQSDERLLFDQHAALRNAISEFRAPLMKSGEIDPRLMHTAEQIVGAESIKFQSEPTTRDREMQPVMTADGRIAGFFIWNKARPMVRAMNQLASVGAGIDVVLFGFATLSLWQLKRARRELAVREVRAARAADEDKLTGLPNHAKTLELLDLALAERADNDCTTFMLIELDGMDDVTAQYGVLGGDELIVAVAMRLKEALPPDAMCGRIAKDEFAVTLTANPDFNVEALISSVLEFDRAPAPDRYGRARDRARRFCPGAAPRHHSG